MLFFVHHKRGYTYMGTGNTAEIDKEDIQPVDVVEAETEEIKPNPQGEKTEDSDIYIDEEGDQEKPKTTNMTKEQSYAAFRKEQEKRKRKNKELEEERKANADLKQEVEELKATVGKIAKGEPPQYHDYDSDEEFNEAVKNYYQAPQPKVNKQTDDNKQASPANDQAEFYLYQQEQEIQKILPKYQESKSDLVTTLENRGVTDPDGVILYLSDLARQKGVDIAKAIVVMSKDPTVIQNIESNHTNPFAIGDILKNAADRVKTRSKPKIDAEPEPDITNTGHVDHRAAKVKRLRDEWVKSPSEKNYKRYMAAKKGN